MKAHIKLAALIIAILLALGFVSRPVTYAGNDDKEVFVDETHTLDIDTNEFVIRNRNLKANCRGAQIAVRIINSIGSESIEEFAQRKFNNLEILRSEENNGVLLLVALEDKDYYIVAGSGLSSVLTTKTLSGIIRNELEPAFRDGEYETAITNAFTKLNEVVCRYYNVDPNAVVEDEGISCGSCSRSGLSCDSCGSCGSCGGLMLFGCAACIGYELFSSIGGAD